MIEYILVGSAFICVIGIILFVHYVRKNIGGIPEFSSCRNPNCVRCVQYRQVIMRADERYHQLCKIQTEVADSTRRLHNSLQRNIVHSNGPGEQLPNDNEPNPLVFSLKELNLNEFYDPWSNDQLADDVNILQNSKEKIVFDFQRINMPQYQHLWLKNDTPFGQWRVFHLINQGKTVVDNVKHCEKTFEIISGLQNIMKRNVFGNVVFSVINPGTKISTHYGPTNIRIRCHLGLITVDECILTVSGKQRKWQEGKCLMFNDAFPHGVTHSGKDGPRCVLIVDLWHPGISLQERNSIDYIFSPISR